MGKKPAEKTGANVAENIKVIVRCRPLNSKEKETGYKSCVDLNLAESTVQVNHVCGDPDRWTFDAVVNNTYTQRDVFNQYIMPMVDSVMDGFNATVFAYGQSGSGKTHTMTGKLDDEDLKGIIPRTFEYVFQNMREQQKNHPNRMFSLSCTFVELYNGKIHDLLAKSQAPLAVKENKDKTFFVQGVVVAQSKFPEDLLRHMEEGTERRRVAATDLNADSSRSHSLFTLTVDMVDTDEEGNTRSVTSKFNLVDLAGSERQSKTGAAGDTLKEGCNINLSLSALGTVIDTLVKGKGHVPFRSSPLTMLLKDSLGGSSKTCMFANIGPSEHNLSETVSTLRFADRAKQIKNKPVVNLDTKDQKIQELTEMVHDLKEKLKQFESVGLAKMEEELEQLRERVGELEVDLDNAVKGREADRLEAQQTKDSMVAELEKVQEALRESADTASSLSAEANLREDQLRDERAQREEIWRACTSHFGDDVGSVDELMARLRLLANSISKEEHVKALSDLRTQNADTTAQRDALAQEIDGLKAEQSKSLEEIDSLKKKLDKAKERLHREKDARRQMAAEGNITTAEQSMVEVASTPNAAWLSQKHELERAHAANINELNEEIRNLREHVQEGTAARDLETLRAAKDAEIEGLRAQLSDATTAFAASADGDDPGTAAYKKVIRQQEEALAKAHDSLKTLEGQNHALQKQARHPCRETSAVVVHDVLKDELKATAEHRDELLRVVASDGGDTNATAQLQRLMDENERLRAQIEALAKRGAEHEGVKVELAQAQNGLADAQKRAHDGDRAVALQNQVDRLQDELRKARSDFADNEAALIAKLSAVPMLGRSGETDDASIENPLASVVDMLKKDKTALQGEVARLTKELCALETHVAESPSKPPTSAAAQEEVKRLHDLLAAPREGDSQEVAVLRDELRHRDESIVKLEEQVASATPMKRTVSSMDPDDLRRSAQDLQGRFNVLELERNELMETIENLKADADEAQGKIDAAHHEAATRAAEAAARAEELREAKRRETDLVNTIADLETQIERIKSDGDSSSAQLEALNARLKERNDQAQELRKAVEHTKEVADNHKTKAEQLRKQLADKQQEAADREVGHQQALAEQESSFQKMMNRRLEQQNEEHKKALARKDEDIAAVKKKIKKLEDKIEKMKEKYDQKVYEYEELVSRMEEQKFEAMRNLRDRDAVVVEENQAKVQDVLKAAKEERRRKADMFANGELSGPAGLARPVQGSAAAAARARGSMTPPSEDASMQPSRSPRPAGYQVGKAVAANPTGGAGYSSYVPEPPRGTPSSGKPLNGGFDMVPDEYLDRGGGGDDIYDF